jgi:hypothetical protein
MIPENSNLPIVCESKIDLVRAARILSKLAFNAQA